MLVYVNIWVCGFQVEKRLDLVKQVTHSTHKKLTACLQGQQGTDIEKRSVKSPSVSKVMWYNLWCNEILWLYTEIHWIATFFLFLSLEKTTTHNPSTMYGGRGSSVRGWLTPGVSHYTVNMPIAYKVIFNYWFGYWILLCPHYPCLHFNCVWLPVMLCLAISKQEDAEAVRGHRREVGPGAHSVWVPDRERCGRTSLCACWSESMLLLLNAPIKTLHLPDMAELDSCTLSLFLFPALLTENRRSAWWL